VKVSTWGTNFSAGTVSFRRVSMHFLSKSMELALQAMAACSRARCLYRASRASLGRRQ
jgi:hypothetical protein